MSFQYQQILRCHEYMKQQISDQIKLSAKDKNTMKLKHKNDPDLFDWKSISVNIVKSSE